MSRAKDLGSFWKPQPQDVAPPRPYQPKPKKKAKPQKSKRAKQWFSKQRRFRVQMDIVPEGARSHIKSILQE